jgi:hypothetical protein
MKVICVFTLCTVCVTGATTAAPLSTQADPLGVIAAYEGTWRAEVEQFNSVYSKAKKTTNIIINDCWRTALFYACAQTVNGKHGALLVFTWDAISKVYTTYPISPDGGSVSKGKLQIEGNDWYYPWDEEKNGVTVHFRVVNHFVGRDTIEYRQEFSSDETQWTVIGRGIEHRQRDSAAPNS